MECRQKVFSTGSFFALRTLQSLDTQKICKYLRTNFKAEDLEKANIIYARGKMSNFEFRVVKPKRNLITVGYQNGGKRLQGGATETSKELNHSNQVGFSSKGLD